MSMWVKSGSSSACLVPEVVVNPSEKNDLHELYFMCDDVAGFVVQMAKRGVSCDSAQDQA